MRPFFVRLYKVGHVRELRILLERLKKRFGVDVGKSLSDAVYVDADFNKGFYVASDDIVSLRRQPVSELIGDVLVYDGNGFIWLRGVKIFEARNFRYYALADDIFSGVMNCDSA